MLLADATRLLQTMTASAEHPVLSAQEITDLLMLSQLADVHGYAPLPTGWSVWAANAALAVGARVRPTAANGHFYTVTASDGAAGAVEPTWPTTTAGVVTLDGVTYTESGAAWAGAWDLNRAASLGWRWKAGKAADEFTFSTEVSSYQRDQLQKHCLDMADRYARGAFGMIDIDQRIVYDPVIGNLNPAP